MTQYTFVHYTNMWVNLVLASFVAVLLGTNKRYRWIYILAKTCGRDFRFIGKYTLINIKLALLRIQNKTVALGFESTVKKNPHKVAFIYEDQTWTFAQVQDFSNKISRYFEGQGFRKGDCVALMLENRPEFTCIWLGLSKLGVITALINTNLDNHPLLHSIKVCNAKGIIFGSNHAAAIKNVVNECDVQKLYQFHEYSTDDKVLQHCNNLRSELEHISSQPLEKNFQINADHPLFYVYTSGTTGLPKAAIFTNIRYFFSVWGIHMLTNFNENDILYDPLPFYHVSGTVLGVGQALVCGVTVVIAKKFSATNYWKDCAKHKCTITQYIGEMCRYILAANHTEPIQHCVRSMFGNGLRPQIWREFVEKFNVGQVFEVYGATEGIANMINTDNTVGSVGFVPRYIRWIYPVTLIKCNEATGEPVRNENGNCIECKINEVGLLVGKDLQKKSVFSFQGYVNKKETEKKILRNVFCNGDSYFNSGDILISDEFGNFFFRDRTGDTFRWKGENVSTTEVEAIISNLTKFNDAIVYGVQVPETEGKAGMVAITDSNQMLDLDKLSNGLKINLPTYAIPIFIRIIAAAPTTGTYKLKKVDLQAEGYNVHKINQDKMYFYNVKLGKYVDLTTDLYEQIVTGKLRL